MEIRNPRRILFLGHSDSGVLSLLKELTGSAPNLRTLPSTLLNLSDSSAYEDDDNDHVGVKSTKAPPSIVATTAGLTHSLTLQNAYYSATVPIWLDEPASTAEWQVDFSCNEAADVVRAVGAWVVVFRLNSSADASRGRAWAVEMMDAVRAVLKTTHGTVEAWDGVLLCVGIAGFAGSSTTAAGSAREAEEVSEWEDSCWERGFEYIDASVKSGSARDFQGEFRGTTRLLEALEANDWSAKDAEEVLGLLGDEADIEFGSWECAEGHVNEEEGKGFALERAEMEREMMGLRMALDGDSTNDAEEEAEGKEEQVDELERMIGRMLAVRDMTAHMPQGDRKRFAARAVHDVMKTI